MGKLYDLLMKDYRLKEGLKGRRILGIAAEQDNQDKVLVFQLYHFNHL